MLQPHIDKEKQKQKKNRDNQDKLGLFRMNSIFSFHILSFLAILISAIGMSVKPKIVDLTKKFGTVETLIETRINCSLEDKVCFVQ